ncbi:hypothetical protein [Nostoc favosum]|uniref:Uncharacterized protein n=1 Tax=Nostoc favosum CHAB5714 TaxID=2780399 RepID=A0ABS8IDE5_9NOSO|nr:hypothetical protein [Nostoc favosum]MCC5602085.1 hypothetical protein [Nostoc favosum CHAB5714]
MTYTVHDALEVANLAAADIKARLCSKPETISVVNVEDDPDYQPHSFGTLKKSVF